MKPTEFHKTYHRRVRSYAHLMAKKWGLPAHIAQDLEQACWLGIIEALPYWKASDGTRAHKSAFNWCAPVMCREMEKVIRTHHGMRPLSSGKIEALTDSEDFSTFQGRSIDVESAIDLKQALQNDPKPIHVARFVLTAINPNEQAAVAVNNRVSRQAICMSVRRTRERLRLALG